MKKLFYFLLLSLVPTSSVLASPPSLQQSLQELANIDLPNRPIDTPVKKRIENGFITITYKDTTNGKVLIEYDSGYKLEGDIKDGLAEGKVILYYPNGQINSESEYKNGKCLSSEKTYYENGKLQSEKDCQNGEYTGFLRNYYENGQNDLAEGLSKLYDEDGKLRAESEYKNGKKNGVSKIYYDNGQLLLKFTFKNNIENGPVEEYYSNGQLHKEYNLKDGIPEGDGKEYYRSGRLYATFTFKDESTQNLTFYYDEPDPILIYSLTGLAMFILGFALTLILAYKRKK